ncbi:MAG: phosphotransacetylase family protein [Synechococcus elongatus]|uniref:phosphotransacetylase family protein n=1 Tax=Synechococcus elongatus TaxID=32046 RepID=UPI0018EF9AC9|nr:phosphotransacetylase family protein [Synechococcus elongatus]
MAEYWGGFKTPLKWSDIRHENDPRGKVLPSSPYLLLGSTEAYSGKSALTLGIAQYFQQQGLRIAYGKPLGTCFEDSSVKPGAVLIDEDVRFIAETLNLSEDQRYPTLVMLDPTSVQRRLAQTDSTDYLTQLQQYRDRPPGDIALIEGAGRLVDGQVFSLDLPAVAAALDAPVLLANRWSETGSVDSLLAAQQSLGDRLLGVVLNAVPRSELDHVRETLVPFLEARGIPVLGLLPQSALLRSVSVTELVSRLNAEVLCCRDRLDLMVESLTIGAMNVNSAMEYFRKGRNMAVVTGGDRADIQLAALETSTQCLILTGRVAPLPQIISRAEEMEIPILSVQLDTLTTVEIIDQAFGQVRLHEVVKAQYVSRLVREALDFPRLQSLLGLPAIAAAS